MGEPIRIGYAEDTQEVREVKVGPGERVRLDSHYDCNKFEVTFFGTDPSGDSYERTERVNLIANLPAFTTGSDIPLTRVYKVSISNHHMKAELNSVQRFPKDVKIVKTNKDKYPWAFVFRRKE